jgi:hypothetical protein
VARVRVIFWLYIALVVAGIAASTIIGLTHG